jgi:hypothetical protein
MRGPTLAHPGAPSFGVGVVPLDVPLDPPLASPGADPESLLLHATSAAIATHAVAAATARAFCDAMTNPTTRRLVGPARPLVRDSCGLTALAFTVTRADD